MEMKAGFAQSVITPPLPIQLAGHRGPRMATSIGDDLLAKALVCSDRDTLYAIVSLDLIWLPRRFIRKVRSEEHTSELQSLMRISYAVFCLQNQKTQTNYVNQTNR